MLIFDPLFYDITDIQQEMRNYMPGPHRRFLELMSRISNIRPYAMGHKSESDVRRAYNAAVLMLGVFRDKHIQIVSRYIIMQSKQKKHQAEEGRVNLATASTEISKREDEDSPNLHGTGGTTLIPFLKQTRDETKGAANYTE
jgi:indoleamine 2,3-dioxygenase